VSHIGQAKQAVNQETDLVSWVLFEDVFRQCLRHAIMEGSTRILPLAKAAQQATSQKYDR